MSYKGYVYDATKFIEKHPGGAEKLMLAAGGKLEPFWGLYQQHNTPHVLNILEELKIGHLEGYQVSAVSDDVDPYLNDPPRSPILKVLTQKPFNAETPTSLLAAKQITPSEFFFIRNHLPVPHVDKSSFKVEIAGLGVRNIKLSLDDLKTLFRKHVVEATLQCSGNRRAEMAQVKPIKGLDWQQGAIGNARWGGVLLRDVLIYAGFDPRMTSDIYHVQFEGLDRDPTGAYYGASIPIEKVVNPESEVLLAFEMNGEELSLDHGFPLRVIVPGVTGARSVKWVQKIILSEKESSSHWQQKDYKVFPNTVDWDNVDWSSAPAMQETSVQSVICEPSPDTEIEVSSDYPEVTLKGFAFSGGGRAIARVDVSPDGGKSWYPARIIPNGQQPNKAWAWVLWTATVTLPPMKDEKEQVTLAVRATDVSGNSQPESPASIWNLRGLANNSWHLVPVCIKC